MYKKTTTLEHLSGYSVVVNTLNNLLPIALFRINWIHWLNIKNTRRHSSSNLFPTTLQLWYRNNGHRNERAIRNCWYSSPSHLNSNHHTRSNEGFPRSVQSQEFNEVAYHFYVADEMHNDTQQFTHIIERKTVYLSFLQFFCNFLILNI